MISWMLYVVFVGLCVVIAASATDWVLRMRRWPVRFVWIGAAILCAVLAATEPLRTRAAPPVAGRPMDLPIALMQTSMQSVERHVSPSAASYAVALWGLASALVSLAFVVASRRLRQASRTWPTVELHGRHVRVSSSVGPIVIGVVRPEIILPQWVLHRSAEEQRVIIAHEGSHVCARDPLILGAACALVALMPWNPALWILLSRVRLAVEIDCDARVLRGGVSPHAYSSLLIDVAERASPLRFATIALSDGSSHLHQRIFAMHPRHVTHPIVRAVSVALIGVAGLLAACEAKMPTAADIDRMDGTSVERSARAIGLLGDTATAVWSIDGVVSTETAAKAIPHDSIVNVSVNNLTPGSKLHIYVVTKRGEQLALAGKKELAGEVQRRERPFANGTLDPVRALQGAIAREQPLLIIDGVRSDQSAFAKLDQSRIAEMQILKGAAAIEEYGNDARRGVIVVRTKAPIIR